MSVLAACLSHTPLQGHFDPAPAILGEVDAAVATLRSRVTAFDPELVFLFAPDHFNGFFYDIMPQFCIATAADALGDFGTLAGPINVASAAAGDCARFLISSEIDIAVSHRMQVDHGFAGPLKDLFGSLSTPPHRAHLYQRGCAAVGELSSVTASGGSGRTLRRHPWETSSLHRIWRTIA